MELYASRVGEKKDFKRGVYVLTIKEKDSDNDKSSKS